MTTKRLANSNLKIVFQFSNNIIQIIVYENGYVAMIMKEADKTHRTVFTVLDVKLIYQTVKMTEEIYSMSVLNPDNCKNGVYELKMELYQNEPAEAILFAYGMHRIFRNIQNSAKKNTQKDIKKANKKLKKAKSINSECEILDNFADNVMDNVETKIDLENALNQLTAKQREVIHKFYFEQLTETEIGKEMEISRCTVQSHRVAALKNLQKILQ